MLALLAPIKERLSAMPALTGFDVRDNVEHVDRTGTPAADVRIVGAVVAESKGSGVRVEPVVRITLIVPRGPGATDRLDAALGAVLAGMQGVKPVASGGLCTWSALGLSGIKEPEFMDVGLVGYELTYTAGATYRAAQRAGG